LVGARGVAFATDSCQKSFNFVNVLAFDKTGNALQIAAAAADKTDAVQFVVFVNVEKDLSRTGAFRRISEHSYIPRFLLFRLYIYVVILRQAAFFLVIYGK
jgi:hypothetical protein